MTRGQRSHSFCNLILNVTFNHFCGSQFIRSQLLELAHIQREGLVTQRHKYQEVEAIGICFRYCLPEALFPVLKKKQSAEGIILTFFNP